MTATAADAPRVVVVTLGGTIASAGPAGAPVHPTLGARELFDGLAAAAGVSLEVHDLARVPSVEVTLADLAAVAERIGAARDHGAVGAVVVTGTDTLEEAAFALDLLAPPGPVVVTGAMRPPGVPGSDGAANLLAALRVAAAPGAADLGALVVLGDQIHAARYVRKYHTASPASFTSPSLGPLGEVVEGRVRLRARVPALPGLPGRHPEPPFPPVALVSISLDDDGRVVRALGDLGHAGVVVEGVGGGHVPQVLVSVLADLVERGPVVLASRTGAGPVLTSTYGYPGGEVDLLSRGLIPAGSLDARHARVALRVLLAAGASRAQVAAWFAAVEAG